MILSRTRLVRLRSTVNQAFRYHGTASQRIGGFGLQQYGCDSSTTEKSSINRTAATSKNSNATNNNDDIFLDRRHFSTTARGGGGGSSSIDKASPPSMLRRVWRSLTAESDDHANAYKIQERKDLYYLLLVTKLREVRLDNPDLEYMEAFNKAFEELEQRGLDDMSNVQLRYEMQDVLAPLVVDVLECFYHVDQQMAPELFQEDGGDFMSDHNYDDYKAVLLDDFETSAARLEEFRSSPDLTSTDGISLKLTRSISFLERKLGALHSILTFHGWANEGDKGATGGQWLSNFPTDFDDEMDDFGFRVTTADEDTFIAIRQYQTVNLYRAAMLRKELGYSVIALKSLVPGAGRGVFIDGIALAGSLVAFQPGPVWPLGSVRPDVEDHFQDNDNLQLSIRYDNFIVDSRRSPYTVLTRPNSNPFSLGHVVNHPQPGSLPNCQSVMLNFTQAMKLGGLHRYVPNTYAVPPAWINRTFDRYVIDMHSMCLLARTDIQEEEMFYDYRLMGTGLPNWYHKINYPEE